MQYPPFDGSRLKVFNAIRHAETLQETFEHYSSSSPFKFNLVDDPENEGKQLLTIVAGQPFPANFALILGDAVHNLRASLDLLACDLVRLEGHEPDGVCFPFCEKEGDLAKMIKRRRFHLASSGAQALLTNLQPYRGGNAMLRGLHDLDIADKHRLIIPVALSAMVQKLAINTPEGGRHVSLFCSYSEGSGWRFSKGSTVDAEEIGARLHFPFGIGTPFDGQPLFETIQGLAELVSGIIESFAALYPSVKSTITVISPTA